MARPVLKRPRDMFTLRRVLAFWAAMLAFTVVAGAAAQTTTSATPTITVTATGVTHTAKRSANRLNTFINHADCLSDDVMTFPITATGFTGYSFQAWVGTNCTDVGTRTLAGQRTCWQVLNSTFQQLSSGSNTSGSTTVKLHVRSMVDGYTHLYDGTSGVTTAGAGGTGGTAGSGGADSTTAGIGGVDSTTAGTGGTTTTAVTATTVNAGIEACDQPSPQNVQAATAITVFFMLVDTSSAAAVASATWAGTFKLVGPQPPDQVTAGVGGNLLVVSFKYSDSATSGDTTRNGFNIYCDPPPGSDAAADAGLVSDGGVGTALVCPDPVTSSVLVTGNDPPIDSQYKCGSGQATSQTANATNLVDGVAYNVAVAAVDTYENTGPLSALACQVPQPITGFYKAYRDAGGRAGGGFCSISNKREPILLIAVLGIASCLVLRRRRSA